MKLTNKTNLNSAASAFAVGVMTPAERARGRYMRSPDGHDAAPAPAGDVAPVSDPVPDAAPAAPTPAAPAEDGDTSPLGGKADDGDAPKADGEGDVPAPVGAPEKYELTVPAELAEKGMSFDAEAFGAVEPIVRELNLDNAQAQKLVDSYAGKILPLLQQRSEAAMVDQAKAQRKEWSDAFDADETIGGANREATLSAAARAFDHYGLKKGEGLRQVLDESGLGFHPDIIRFVAGVGRDLAEGSFERGSAVQQPKSAEQKLYGAEFQPK